MNTAIKEKEEKNPLFSVSCRNSSINGTESSGTTILQNRSFARIKLFASLRTLCNKQKQQTKIFIGENLTIEMISSKADSECLWQLMQISPVQRFFSAV